MDMQPIRHGADAAESEEHGDGNNQTVIRRTLAEKQLENPAEYRAQNQYAQVGEDGHHDGGELQAPCFGSDGDGNRHAVQNQSDDVIQRDDLKQRIDEVAVRAGLTDGHHRGRGRGRRSQRGQHDGKAQFQMQHAVDQHKDSQRRHTGFQHRDDDDLCAVAPKHIDFKKLARAERDKRQRDIRKKVRTGNDLLRNDIEAAGTHQDAREDVARYVGQPQTLRDARHREACEKHRRNRNNDPRDGRGLHGFDQFAGFLSFWMI